MADIFDVIADVTRRDLLQALLDRRVSSDSATRDMSVGEMVTQLGLTQPTVSKHLKVLRDNSFVRVREMGQHRYYSLDAAPLEYVEDWLIPFLSSDFDDSDDGGVAVFTAWSGAQLPASLRRAAESLPLRRESGNALGRAGAGAAYRARVVIRGAQHRIVTPIRKKLGR